MSKVKSNFNRNSMCFCGSRKKYKKCCLGKNEIFEKLKLKGIKFKNNEDIKNLRKIGNIVIKTLDLVETKIKPGITTNFINNLVHDFTIKNGAVPAPLNYLGFPKSVCISVNDVICHGIPSERILLDGDIVNVDVTSILNGYYADASKTFFVGNPKTDANFIVDIAKKCLILGVSMVKPGNFLNDIGKIIQNYAESNGCSVVREFVGHGIGFDFHEPPQVPHYIQSFEKIPILPNMTFTIEPMINFGKKDLKVLDDGWTVITKDGSLSAQFEQTICVTENGCEVLTPYN